MKIDDKTPCTRRLFASEHMSGQKQRENAERSQPIASQAHISFSKYFVEKLTLTALPSDTNRDRIKPYTRRE